MLPRVYRRALGPLAVSLLLIAATRSARADETPVVIVGLGDSTTAGSPFFLSPAESPPEGSGDPEGQYGYWLAKNHPTWKFVNLGIRGQRSDEIRSRFEEAFQYNPRYLIILAGVNDIYQGSSLRELCKNLEWMYQQSKLRSVMPIAGTILPFDQATAQQSADIKRVNEWIKEATDRHRIGYIDFHAAVADPTNPNKLNGSPDGIHPDVGGYRSMGKRAEKEIEHLERAHKTISQLE